MAINFEAANMAGYNNPKIEVFKATAATGGTKLAQYPDKAAIIAAINRGSIPVILLKMTGADSGYVLHLHSWFSDTDGDVIRFCDPSSLIREYAILYPADSGTPTLQSYGGD